jgi:hypothetical protein
VSPNQISINDDYKMDNMEALRTQNDDTKKLEDTPTSSKRHKKLRYDKLPTPPPERNHGTSRRATYKNGKD